MAFMTKQLDKIFIGYGTSHGDAADGDVPKAFLIVMLHGEIEAWADAGSLLAGQPLHWEVCHSVDSSSRETALLEARRVAAHLGLARLGGIPRTPVVTGDVTVISPKKPV